MVVGSNASSNAHVCDYSDDRNSRSGLRRNRKGHATILWFFLPWTPGRPIHSPGARVTFIPRMLNMGLVSRDLSSRTISGLRRCSMYDEYRELNFQYCYCYRM